MTQLLVSVRNAREAELALAGGADFIDLKEPDSGALGWALPDDLRAAAEFVGRRAPLSAALGELIAPPPPMVIAALAGYQFAKVGLAFTFGRAGWAADWRKLMAQLPPGVSPVAAVYADWERAGAPPPEEVFDLARNNNCAALLVDTFVKDGSTCFDWMNRRDLAALFSAARQDGLMTVIAGSLRAQHLPQALQLTPDVVAVRGAVSLRTRSGRISKGRVAEFRKELARNSLKQSRATGHAARR